MARSAPFSESNREKKTIFLFVSSYETCDAGIMTLLEMT